MWKLFPSKKVEVRLSGYILENQTTELFYPLTDNEGLRIIISINYDENGLKILNLKLFSLKDNHEIGGTEIKLVHNKIKDLKKKVKNFFIHFQDLEILNEMEILKRFSYILSSSREILYSLPKLKAVFLMSLDGFVLDKYISQDFNIKLTDEIDVVASTFVDIAKKTQALFKEHKLTYLHSIFNDFSVISSKIDEDLLLLVFLSPPTIDLKEYYKFLKKFLASASS